MKKFLLLYILTFLLSAQSFSQTAAKKQAICVSAIVQESTPQIILTWPLFNQGDNYSVYRRKLGEPTWGTALGNPAINDTLFVDQNVSIGEAYEYKVMRISGGYITAFGYIYSGIKVPETDFRGAVLLLVDDAYQYALQTEIDRLVLDMISDGWRVITKYVNRGDSIPLVKQRIIDIYNKNPDLKSLYLLGHIPVPYSGDFTVPPDGHVVGSGSHTDAWPADVYYADMDGVWTDQTVNKQTAKRELAWNIPGDGKFDQTLTPSAVELEMGRVDLYNMSYFSSDDTALIAFYLEKNHNFRIGNVNLIKRGILDDNFTSLNLASTGWDNMAAVVGHHHIDVLDYMSTMKTKPYLWSYGCGAGSFTSCSGIGTSKTFSTDTVNTVFTILAGSYFGDWDNANNYLRAPLASKPYALTSFWGGIPKWHIFHMGLGMHIGFGARLTQNNTDYTNQYFTGLFNYSQGEVHIALMGDPTLRMHVVSPPSNIMADSIGNVTCQISWDASTDDIIGYNIYRSATISQKFEKINQEPVTATSYIDNASLDGNNVYMVRALKLELSPSGSYYNMSQGILDSTSTAWPASMEDFEKEIVVSAFPNPSQGQFRLYVQNPEMSNLEIEIVNVYGQRVFREERTDAVQEFYYEINIADQPKGIYTIRVRSKNRDVVRKLIVN
ncbi:T9SS type A sorting domain-containing protein [Bacteroidota bacterium]